MYSFIYRNLIYPLLFFAFQFLALLNPKVKKALLLRASQNSQPPWLNCPAQMKPVWFHCASGEFEYAKPVINALKKQKPEIKILLTYFSPSILESVQNFKNLDFFCPLPWDQPKVLAEFINFHKPRALLIARTDAWPEMLTQAKLTQLPSLLFSATLAKQSSRMNFIAKGFTSWTLGMLTKIHCVSQDDLENFRKLGLSSITQVCGDTRYDQVIDRLKNQKPIKDRLFRHPPEEKIFVAGSTWPEDEEVLFKTIHDAPRNFKFVLVPHEPTTGHIEELKKKAQDIGKKAVLYSETQSWDEHSILIVDQIGILAEIYAYASLAFVGGSFRKSVHSVMEPLAAGCLTFVGPKHQTNREALFMKKALLASIPTLSPVIEVKNAKELTKYLKTFQTEDLSEVAKEIQSMIVLRAGVATEKIIEWLAPFVGL